MSNETRKSEAKAAKTVPVVWRGHAFEIATEYDEWTVDFLESLEEGKSVGIVRGALGPKQWPTVKQMDLKVGELGELASAITAALGFKSSGESSASSD